MSNLRLSHQFRNSFVALLATAIFSANAAGAEFEDAPVFKASEILSADMLSGDNFRVQEEVGSDGYWDIYTVETEFGEFSAHGWIALRELIREIDAIAALMAMSKTQVFLDSMVENGIKEPIDLAVTIVSHPVQTVTGLPRGIKNMFLRYGRKAKKIVCLLYTSDAADE